MQILGFIKDFTDNLPENIYDGDFSDFNFHRYLSD